MASLESVLVVFLAGLISDLATGAGAIPFLFNREYSDRSMVRLWGLAFGIMFFASVMGLIPEGLAFGSYLEVGAGIIAGSLLVAATSCLLEENRIHPGSLDNSGGNELMLILGVLTVHSLPEGLSIGVAFSAVETTAEGFPFMGLMVPPVALLVTAAISIQNIPEGVAVSIPFNNLDRSWREMFYAAVFSSAPQPLGAVMAFLFVTELNFLMPFSFGFAAGAMIYLVMTRFIQEARDQGAKLADWRQPFLLGISAGFIIMGLLILLL